MANAVASESCAGREAGGVDGGGAHLLLDPLDHERLHGLDVEALAEGDEREGVVDGGVELERTGVEKVARHAEGALGYAQQLDAIAADSEEVPEHLAPRYKYKAVAAVLLLRARVSVRRGRGLIVRAYPLGAYDEGDVGVLPGLQQVLPHLCHARELCDT